MKKSADNNVDIKPTVLITGGLGFIGMHLILQLIKRGYCIIIVDNCFNSNESKLMQLPSDRYVFINLDICNEGALITKLKKYPIHILIHLAAVSFIPFCNENSKITMHVNYEGTKNMLKLGKRLGIKRCFFASSAAVYKPSVTPHSEEDMTRPIDIYGRSKWKSEIEVMKFCKRNGIAFTIFRLFNVYGENDLTSHFIPSLLSQMKASRAVRLGNLNTIRDYIHVDDVVNLIVSAIQNRDRSRNEIVNVGTGKGAAGKDIVRIMEGILVREGYKLRIVIDKRLQRKNDRPILVSDSNKASKLFGWKPKIELADGLHQLVTNNAYSNKRSATL